MNILLIGSGGREHALAKAIKDSDSVETLFCAPCNPGILNLAENANINSDNFKEVHEFCINEDINLVVVGPEQPLADGIADYLTEHNIPVFGPVQKAAQLESSKDFAKQIMSKYNIPTAQYKTFSVKQKDDAEDFINEMELPIVIKADGLAAGKGVMIAYDYDDALDMLDEIFDGKFGNAGNKVVIEEFLDGEEASIFAITDGVNYITLPASQDHKRAFDGDEGPNTGGMGAYAPAKIVTDEVLEQVKNEIISPLIKGLKTEGINYRGCIYCGLIIKDNRAKVIEFNVRFGDPETQVVIPLIRGDFARLLYSAAIGNLEPQSVEFLQKRAACCVVLASDGYPDEYEKGFEITGISDVNEYITTVYHAGTKLDSDKLLTNGGRVLGVTSIGFDLEQAIKNVYAECDKIYFDNIFYRYDIGQKGL